MGWWVRLGNGVLGELGSYLVELGYDVGWKAHPVWVEGSPRLGGRLTPFGWKAHLDS